MQAIQTKFIPATNTKPSRIKATCERGSLTVDYPHELSGEECHVYAVNLLLARFDNEDRAKYGTKASQNPWLSPFATGCLPDGSYAHVFVATK